jgi:glucose-fructose oxidoreductase
MPAKPVTRKRSRPRTRSQRLESPVRYAVIGLGHIAQAAVLPAFAHASGTSKLAALVSDDPAKLRQLGRRYKAPLTGSYEELETILGSGEVDAVYIALPNHLHREYTERAARAGMHVLCEKPMAVTAKDCRAMIQAAQENQVKLMVAYRLHFEPANLLGAEIVNGGKLGTPRIFNSVFTMQVKAGDIRVRKDTGGGPLYDIGIYCINAARYLFRAEPVEAVAFSANIGDERFREVDEMTSAVLRYPDERLASFTVSFGADDVSAYQVVGTKGNLIVDPAYEYHGELKHRLSINGRKRERTFPMRDQFAAELDYFSRAIREDTAIEPSAEEGLADVQIIEALLNSADTGRTIALDLEGDRPPRRDQQRSFPPTRKVQLVKTESPSID